MKIKIWGARGSIPSPLKPQEVREKVYQAVLGAADIEISKPEAVRAYVDSLDPLQTGTAGGNTTCVEVRASDKLIIVDAGSGIRELGLELMKGPCGRGEGEIHLLFSHAHWDHIQGFPFFVPAFIPGNRIYIYSVHDLQTVLVNQQQMINFPVPVSYMQATMEFIKIKPRQPFEIGKVKLNTIETIHPNKAYAFRFEDDYSTFVFASDAEYQELVPASMNPYIKFYQGADALIFDAQFTLKEGWEKRDWGHSSAMIGADIASAANVKKLILFHHDPTYSDTQLMNIQENTIHYLAQNTTTQCEVLVAYEGLTLDLKPEGTLGLQVVEEMTVVTPFDELGFKHLDQQLIELKEADETNSSIIDLSQVESLTTASLKSLVSLSRERPNASIVLAGPSRKVRKIIELAGFSDIFAIYPNSETALEALKAQELLNLQGHLIKQQYQIETKQADGRMGMVLKATDTKLNRPVAIKILSVSLSDMAVDRFLRQAEQLINMEHGNIVDVFDCGKTDHFAFIVEEYAPGNSLHELFQDMDEMLPPEQATEIGLQIARGLEYAHARGIIHGDLQPRNIVLVSKTFKANTVKVRRFGMGRFKEGHTLLETSLILQSAYYLAPEQILGHVLDARTDLYSLGIILYELFTGQPPFDGSSDRAIMETHLQQEPTPPSQLNPNLSRPLNHFILKLLAKNPNERYANALQAYHILSNLNPTGGSSEDTTASKPQRNQLVGRKWELNRLLQGWKVTRQGQGKLFFLSGETGIGKTRLIEEIAFRSHGGVVLLGHCQRWEGSPAYQPFVEILRAYFATVPPEVIDQQDNKLLSEVARLVPEIRNLVPGLPKTSYLMLEQEQLRLMTSITRFIEQATKRRPWLLILEDLHWADESTLQLLTYLGRHCTTIPLLIVGTYRDTDLAIKDTHPLLDTLRSLNRHPTYQKFTLKRLAAHEVEQLVSNIFGQKMPLELIEQIYERTEGNPVYVEEIIGALIDEGYIVQQVDGWQVSQMGEIRLPQTVRDAVMNRISHLNSDTQKLLRQAAVLGRTFKFDDLRAMSGLSEWEVLERLDIALERQLIHETFGETTLSFNHSEIRQVLYEDMSNLRQRMLHLQAGEALERRMGGQTDRVVEQLAYHFGKAGQFEKSIMYSIEAARQAETTYATKAALHWYKRVLELSSHLPPEKAAEFQMFQRLARESLGELLTISGGFDEALAHYEAVQQLINKEPPSPEKTLHLANLCGKIARVYKKRADFDTSLKYIEKGLSYLDISRPTLEVARIYLLGAEVYDQQANNEDAIAWCNKGLEMAAKIQTRSGQRTLAWAYYLLGNIYRGLGEFDKALQLCQDSLRVYEQLDDQSGLSRAYIATGNVYADQGKWTQASDALERSLALKKEIGDLFDQGRVLNNLATLEVNRGNYKTALDLFEQSLAMWHQDGNIYFEAAVFSNLASVYIQQQKWSQAEQMLQESQKLLTEIKSEKLDPEVERRWAKLYLNTERADEALQRITRSIELASRQKDPMEEAMSYRVLGEIKTAQNQFAAANEALQQSLDILVNLSSEYEAAKTKLALAHLPSHTTTSSQQTLLNQAITTFEKLGAKADLATALALQQAKTPATG